MDHADFLERVYALYRPEDWDAATDLVFDYVDELLVHSAFAEADRLLQEVQVDRLAPTVMRSFLTITYPARTRLPSWPLFLDLVQTEMRQQIGVERTENILRFLKREVPQ